MASGAPSGTSPGWRPLTLLPKQLVDLIVGLGQRVRGALPVMTSSIAGCMMPSICEA